MRQKHVFVMVKEPRPGRVKTRLGKDIGLVNSAWWFRHKVSALLRRLSQDRRWQITLAVAPDQAGLQSRIWPARFPRWAQGRGNLGDRMHRIFAHAPPGPIVIIGADIPDVTPAAIAEAFDALGSNDVVFGPAPDGGYWLVGMARRTQRISAKFLKNVRWSSQHALADSVASAQGYSVGFIRELRDVDTVADL